MDLRLITATHRQLRAEVKAGRFREDLYDRLNVLEIELPPLAERKEDIPTLSAFLLARLSPGRELSLGPDAARMLSDYNWPGNVRELRNALEHAATVCSGKTIRPHHLPSRSSVRTMPPGRRKRAWIARCSSGVAARVAAGATYKQIYSGTESTILSICFTTSTTNRPFSLASSKMNRATLLKKCRELRLGT